MSRAAGGCFLSRQGSCWVGPLYCLVSGWAGILLIGVYHITSCPAVPLGAGSRPEGKLQAALQGWIVRRCAVVMLHFLELSRLRGSQPLRDCSLEWEVSALPPQSPCSGQVALAPSLQQAITEPG